MTNDYLEESVRQKVLAHFHKVITEDMERHAIDVALVGSRYIFVSSGKMKKGYCTHCRSAFYIEGPVKQNGTTECPKCNSKCIYKHDWRSRMYLRDSAYFLWFEKSLIDPEVFTAMWVHVKRDYSGDFKKVENEYTKIALYTFKLGESAMYDVHYWRKDALIKMKSVHSPQLHYRNTVATESLKDAITGTQFEYSGWEQYRPEQLLKYFALFAQHPSAEILTKSGYRHIVLNKMYGQSLHRAINWKAFKLHDIFKVSKQDMDVIKEESIGSYSIHSGVYPTIGLSIWHQTRKEKSTLTYAQLIRECSTLVLGSYLQEFKRINKYTTVHRIFNYAHKQFKKAVRHYSTPGQVLITWRDYIMDCNSLNLDLKDDLILFPKDLRRAHERTMKQVKIQADEIADRKVKKRYEQLENMIFEADGFVIHPPETVQEIIDEGKKLSHCVGGYADKHYNGKCSLLFIRKTSQKDKPYYTVEIVGNEVKQIRGFKNAPPTDEVKQFVGKFEKAKVKKSKARKAV
ncbi:PcfJ domain-containing protein [Lysinibacillus sphaericus]|uniref:PcfJ domain-containing protein n=1 Tax=Lysinibacillus sphaericus TaxID=1421 RepID=UPI003D039BDA